jgi:DNA-binding response OmpR family regulator
MSTRLLVVESREPVRSAYETYFARAGFEVRAVATVAEALEWTEHVGVDAVIADAGLDVGAAVNGLALVSYFRSHHVGIPPATVLTAYGWPECAALAARLGVDIFLHKPASLAWLEAELRGRVLALQERRGRASIVTSEAEA